MLRIVFLRLVHAFVALVYELVAVVVDLVGGVLGGVQVVVHIGLAGLQVAAVAVIYDVLGGLGRNGQPRFAAFAGQHYFKSSETLVLLFSGKGAGGVDVDLGQLVLHHDGVAAHDHVVGVPDVDPARHIAFVAVGAVHVHRLVALPGFEGGGPGFAVVVIGGRSVVVLPQQAVGVLKSGLGQHVRLGLPHGDGAGLAFQADESGESRRMYRKDGQDRQDHQKRHAPGGGKISKRLFHIARKKYYQLVDFTKSAVFIQLTRPERI